VTVATVDFVLPAVRREPPELSSTSIGDEIVEFAETCGILLDPWQQWCIRMATAERADGSWAAFECGVVTPRQNGKNYYLRALQLGYLFLLDDELLIHSAHQWDTVNVHRRWVMELLESHDEFGELLKPVDRRTGRSKSFVNVNGDEQIVLTTGQSVVFKTRSSGKARGFTGDKVFFDEAQKLAAGSMGDTVPVLSTRPGAQVHYTGSAPNAKSAVLHAVRVRGRSDNTDDRLFFAEWGNEPDVIGLDPDSDEFLAAIRNVNPAVSAGRITEDYIRQEIRTFSGDPDLVEEHRRERLGIPTFPAAVSDAGPFSLDVWSALAQVSQIETERSWSITISPDRQWAALGVAGRRADGLLHVEWMDHRAGTNWLLDRCVEAFQARQIPVHVHANGPEASMIGDLVERGVTVVEVSTADYARATGRLIDAVNGRTLRHLGQRSLDQALTRADLKTTSAGSSVWIERTVGADITTLKAVTVALHGVRTETDDGEAFVATVLGG